jgi:hypothetical protein
MKHVRLPLRDDQVLVAAATLRQMPTAEREQLVSPLATLFRRHLSRFGWPLGPLPCSPHEALTRLRKGQSRAAAAYLKAVFPSFWRAGNGPAVRFLEPGVLERVLPYRLGLNAKNECFDISLAELRRAAQVQRYTVSFFQPAFAYDLYRKMDLPPEPTVWDPSCGFGARMLGFYAAYPKGRYLGNEPARATFDDLQRLGRTFPSAHLICRGSEHGPPRDEACDLVLTCPPYFDKERYFEEPGQCWRDYPTHDAWKQHYVVPTLEHAARCLKVNGTLVVVTDEEQPWHEAASRLGLTALGIEPIAPRLDHYARARNASRRTQEKVLRWQKR